jgi:hypothetical protein
LKCKYASQGIPTNNAMNGMKRQDDKMQKHTHTRARVRVMPMPMPDVPEMQKDVP